MSSQTVTTPDADAIRLVAAFAASTEGEFTPADAEAATGVRGATVRGYLRQMLKAGELSQPGYGRYLAVRPGGDGGAPQAPTGAADRAPALLSDAPQGYTSADLQDTVTYAVVPHGHAASRAGSANEDGEPRTITLPRTYIQSRFGRVPGEREMYLSYVRGDSMEPWLRDGQPIWVERVNEFIDGGRYCISMDGSEEFVKRVARRSRRRLVVSADNRAYSPVEYEHVEDETYRDVATGDAVTISVQGRVIDPADTAAATLREIVASISEINRR